MRHSRCQWVGLLLVLLALVAPSLPGGILAPLHAGEGDEDDPDAIPLVGRPADLPFSEASGSFRIDMNAEPTTVQMEDPITLTVCITATDTTRKPPRRPNLNELPSFRKAFYIEDLPDTRPGLGLSLGSLASQNFWVFRYRLKPKSLDVKEIPSLPFVFYNPKIISPGRRFMVLEADPIELEVKPREALRVALEAPAAAFDLELGPGLFAREAAWAPPGLGGSLLLLLLPPALCGVWYLVWQRLYPDAARLASQRRSRAAQLALAALQRLPQDREQRAAGAVTAVTRYLRQRLDLPVQEPTPLETAGYLKRAGCSATLAAEALRFYQACDAARFLPEAPAEASALPQQAIRLILAVEAETWREPRP